MIMSARQVSLRVFKWLHPDITRALDIDTPTQISCSRLAPRIVPSFKHPGLACFEPISTCFFRCDSIASIQSMILDGGAVPLKHARSPIHPCHILIQSPHTSILNNVRACQLSVNAGLQSFKGRRNLFTHALQDLENQPDGILKVSTTETDELEQQAQVNTEKTESGIVLWQGVKVDNEDNTVMESESDLSSESSDHEKDFYEYLEDEENPEELLSMLLDLEKNFPAKDPRVCFACLRLAELCYRTNANLVKILDYARQAFHNFNASKYPIESAKSWFLMGVANFKMGEIEEAVNLLRSLVLMMAQLTVPLGKEQDFAVLRYSARLIIGQAEMSLGRDLEGTFHLEDGLANLQEVLPPGHPCLASFYKQTADVYLQYKKPQEALRLCLKALPIYRMHCGPSSSEEAALRSFMLHLYYELNEYEKVLHECELARPVLESVGKFEEAISLDLESMQAFFCLGKIHEAVVKLNEIINKTEEHNPLHIEALILLGRAFDGLKDKMAAAEYCKKALILLERNELTLEFAKSMMRLAMAYEKLGNNDQALAVSLRVFEFLENCTEREAGAILADVEGYMGFLFLSNGKPDEAIHHLERSVIKKKSIYGPQSEELLDVCNHLGVAYAHTNNVTQALDIFKAATKILANCKERVDMVSIYIHNNLSLTCRLCGRMEEAISWKKDAIVIMRKASKRTSINVDEAEEELEALVQAAQNGKAFTENKSEMLQKMRTPCTQAFAIK